MAISTAAARYIYNGARDLSTRKIPPVPKNQPQHLPKFFIVSPKGPYEEMTLTGGELMRIFGEETLDKRSKYASHITVFLGELLSNGGGAAVIKRLRPKVVAEDREANIANIGFYLLTSAETDDKPYVRDAATYKVERDSNNSRQKDESKNNIKVRYTGVVAKRIDDLNNFNEFNLTIDGIAYTATPLFYAPAEAHGEYYNNIGIGLEANVGNNLDQNVLEKEKAITWTFKLFDKSSGVNEAIRTIYGSEEVKFGFKPLITDPLTNQGIELTDLVPELYGNHIDPNFEISPYTLGEIKEGDKISLEARLGELYATEAKATTLPAGITDITNGSVVDGKEYLIDFLTQLTTTGVEYEAIRPMNLTATAISDLKNAGLKVVSGNKNVPTYLEGGEDGDVEDLDHIESLVVAEMEKYMDPYSEVQNLAKNEDRIFYDSGFKFDNKLKLAKYIGLRPDTFIAFTPYTFNKENKKPTLMEYIGLANAIQSNVRLYPESVKYNTPTARSAIVMGDMLLADKSYRYRMPLLLDYAIKMQKFMGALDGTWNGTYEFSTQPQNIIDTGIDINPADIPDPVKDSLWKAGIIWAENEDKLTYFFTSHQTVYPDDTSVLNTIPTAIAIGTVVRASAGAWRAFTGSLNLTDIELKVAVEQYMRDALKDKFNGQIKVQSEVVYTELDKIKGYSWHLNNYIYANNMKTVMYIDTNVFRMSDLQN